jgi:hypothetical protein
MSTSRSRALRCNHDLTGAVVVDGLDDLALCCLGAGRFDFGVGEPEHGGHATAAAGNRIAHDLSPETHQSHRGRVVEHLGGN